MKSAKLVPNLLAVRRLAAPNHAHRDGPDDVENEQDDVERQQLPVKWPYHVLYFVALGLGTASFVVAITACYPLAMYFLAICFLKEQLNRFRFLGILLISVGGFFAELTQ